MRDDIRTYADEVVKTIEAIVDGNSFPYAPEIEEWALSISDQVGPVSDIDDPVILAIVDCLVDILTCDGRSWDTPLWGFEEHLSRLSAELKSTCGDLAQTTHNATNEHPDDMNSQNCAFRKIDR